MSLKLVCLIGVTWWTQKQLTETVNAHFYLGWQAWSISYPTQRNQLLDKWASEASNNSCASADAAQAHAFCDLPHSFSFIYAIYHIRTWTPWPFLQVFELSRVPCDAPILFVSMGRQSPGGPCSVHGCMQGQLSLSGSYCWVHGVYFASLFALPQCSVNV